MGRSWETILRQAFQGDGVITGKDRAERELLRRKCVAGTVDKLHANIFVLNEKWESQDIYKSIWGLAQALSRQKYPQRKIYCLVTAAILWGLEVPYRLHDKNELHLVGEQDGHSLNSVCRYFSIKCPTTVEYKGIVYTDLLQTLADCVDYLPFSDALAIIESALRNRLLNSYRDELITRLKENIKLRLIFMHASALSESIGESIAKASMIELGFQVPLQQINIFPSQSNDFGGLYRVDFLWKSDEGLIVGEFDGVGKYYIGGENVHSQVSKTVGRERERDANLLKRGISRILHFDYQMVLDQERFARYLSDSGVPRVR